MMLLVPWHYCCDHQKDKNILLQQFLRSLWRQFGNHSLTQVNMGDGWQDVCVSAAILIDTSETLCTWSNAEWLKCWSVYLAVRSVSRWTTMTSWWQLSLVSSWWPRRCHNSSTAGTSRHVVFTLTLMDNCVVCMTYITDDTRWTVSP